MIVAAADSRFGFTLRGTRADLWCALPGSSTEVAAGTAERVEGVWQLGQPESLEQLLAVGFFQQVLSEYAAVRLPN